MRFTALCLFAALATVGLADNNPGLLRPECKPSTCTAKSLGQECTTCSNGIPNGKCHRYVHPYLELSYSINLLLICTARARLKVVGTTAKQIRRRSCRTAVALFGHLEQQRKPAGERWMCTNCGERAWTFCGVGGGGFSRWARGLRRGVGVDIWHKQPSTLAFVIDFRVPRRNVISGVLMLCPHSPSINAK
jgi:hypothetical protein